MVREGKSGGLEPGDLTHPVPTSTPPWGGWGRKQSFFPNP